MKYKKGLAPIVIILIVLGIAAICGFAYFEGKNSTLGNSGICGENGEFCPGTPAYEKRMNQQESARPQVSTILPQYVGDAFHVRLEIQVEMCRP